MKTNLTGLSMMAILGLSACSPESNTLVSAQKIENPPAPEAKTVSIPVKGWMSEDGGQKQLEFNPQVDILFVIDNSDSMRSAEANLVRNIDRFADGIVKNKMIDYHIGVVSTWDSSERYAKAKKDAYQIGDLRFLKDSNEKPFNQRFLTRKEDKSLLASTLKIGVLSYADGGPEVEEFFSPLAAALDKSARGATNDGFFRENAQLVVVFMTDADDSTSQLTPEQMARKLVDFKGGRADKVTVYGALVKAADADEYKDWDLRVHPKYHPECFDMTKKAPKNTGKCSGFGPENLEKLIVLANSGSGTPKDIRDSNIMSIISKTFGTDLGKIGDNITIKILSKEIRLSQRPKSGTDGKPMIRVRYGTTEELAEGKGRMIPPGSKGGWLYDADNNTLHLAGDIKYDDYQEGSRFAVELVPVTIAE